MTTLHVAIPAYHEHAHLPATLKSLAEQTLKDFTVWVCVNEPEGTEYNHPEAHRSNIKTLELLKETAPSYPFKLNILNQISSGHGVGWARDLLAKRIIESFPQGITVCLDADTILGPRHLEDVRKAFKAYPNAAGLAAPYFHEVPSDSLMARNLLRYEIYMRYYQIQLWKIDSPYAYLALGSAMAYRHSAWKAVRGIPHRQAGEDFYFLQKLRKTRDLIRWIPSTVHPSSRYSQRVPFGTGILLREDTLEVQNTRFPFFSHHSFEKIKTTCARFPDLYKKPTALPIDSFLESQLHGQTPFDKIRRNSRTQDQFIRNAHQYFDGLRILQFLRFDHISGKESPEKFPLDFSTDPIEELAETRMELFMEEQLFQRRYMESWSEKTSPL